MRRFERAGATVMLTLAVAASFLVIGATTAFASVNTYWSAPTSAASVTNGSGKTYIKTYGVRAGSAGADFMGVTNTNYDFVKDASGAGYSGTSSASANAAVSLSLLESERGFGIWASAANENPNPYYWNLFYEYYLDNQTAGSGDSVTNAATTHWSNGNSWGDTSGAYNNDFGVVYGLEYRPEILFGANKASNWNAAVSDTNYGKYITYINHGYYGNGTDFTSGDDSVYDTYHQAGDSTYDPTVVNNDATNIWTQVYTMGKLAQVAEGIESADSTKTTRYDNGKATTSAVDYEKAIKGNLLYIASQIDSGAVAKKKVAYLYAIDNGTAYFFVPTASGLTTGSDTNADTSANTATNADSGYAANNGTIDLGYMATLPYVTNTFDSGNHTSIVMKVEDIFKSNPACTVSSSDTTGLKDVDAIIYNTNTGLTATGTSNGLNSTGIVNTGDFASGINSTNLKNWLANSGFSGSLIAGDDWGTGTKQSSTSGMAQLYCQRNYTADKNARAAYMYAQIYPSLYTDSYESYSYWVNKVYHIQTASVVSVVNYMTQMTTGANWTDSTLADMESKFAIGYNWWKTTGKASSTWGAFDYYNGSSRSSYYDGTAASEEPSDTIGIMAPSALWTASMTSMTVKAPGRVILVKSRTLSHKAGQMTVVWKKVSGATGYQILYRVGTKTYYKTITSGATVSKVITSLKKGKSYAVKVRALKTVSGKKYYGAYSASKTVKIKS